MDSSLLVALVACGLSLVLSAGTLTWCLVFAPPSIIRKRVEAAEVLAKESQQAFESLENRFVQHKAEILGLAEAIDGQLESVERKRRQISAASSRLSQTPAEAEPQTREQIVQHYRGKVYNTQAG